MTSDSNPLRAMRAEDARLRAIIDRAAEFSAAYDERLIIMVEAAAAANGHEDAMRVWLASVGDERSTMYMNGTEIERIALRSAFTGRALAAAAELARMTRRIMAAVEQINPTDDHGTPAGN
jgi:hypothetical protein